MTTETLPPVQGRFMTMDLLLYRRFRREVPDLVERTYALNPGLAGQGAFLPVGTRVVVEIPEPAPARATRVLRLTD